ncbi:N-acylmannosamine kinase [Erwinia toletana]|uniref:N-acylmannosamine kinase n=1 Tax=Winslowiella toletana TaxID=92490 RepID=A0ABS4PAP8_9GAMM|nr:N-acetylmannosamine kinase [Winslowiella toletana]MBP2169715.1 N-acylmannosamine kinase [Winslowiella toletana]
MGKCLAVDIGGSKIASALVDKNGQLSDRQQIITPRSGAAAFARSLQQLLRDWQSGATSIAVASTGIIRQGKLVALNPANLGGIANFPLATTIEQVSKLPYTLLNDAQAAAWAEYQALPTSDVDNMLFITVSTGVGGGIILNRTLQTGNNGLSGHIGHILADLQGPLCGCGRYGCVESIASGTAIAAATCQWPEPLTTAEVFAQASAQHQPASAIIDRSASAIARLIADITMALDIQRVVIGGSVGLAPGYLARVSAAQQHLPAICRTPLQPAFHRQDSGLLGAALWAAQGFC